ncbi:FAD-dependent monooxygenase [Haloechinothrix sp. YIM 98757]|uniref:FAD-dependent monooxygenase n=1 Tax=Haloechinothrix aidingensis TaxID=2752311 RepID=A0A838AB03_9PSEU|nr:FAD-dependent monooxygenase [Haloechinothrix aidingensis]MBA0126398.1 FAD-dependent monooxygenase [Haloechinothrix aidingensis]
MSSRVIGIVGGGIGGLAAGVALCAAGYRVEIYEQAERFARVGADVNLTPNAVRALDGLGIGASLRETAARPTHRISRMWDTGEETSRLEMSGAAEKHYGSPQLTMHRADVLSALESALPEGTVRFGKRLAGIDTAGACPVLRFADGSESETDVVIGADGIHSAVRTALLGPEHPTFTGVVAYRAVIPASRLSVPDTGVFTKWWGPDADTQIVTFPLNRGQDTFVFATTPQQDWLHESWTMPGSVDELRAAYQDFHPEARALLDACDEVMKSALYVREPLPHWSSGAVTLLGDACHPMMPFMAQGAGMAIEDAVVLARALDEHDVADIPVALKRYESARKERTSRIQASSRDNTWLKSSTDADWVYGYDAWTVPLG